MPDPDIVIAALGCLTPREAEAVLWVAQGKTSWEAGRILGVSEHTLNAHVVHAAEKLDAANRAHMVARAFVRGILAPALSKALSLLLAVLFASAPPINARRPPRRPRRQDEIAMVDLRVPGGA